MIQIRHETAKRKGMFIVDDDEGKRIAEMDYFANAPGEITIYHTEVDEKHRGEGLGRDLVEAAVKHARENKLRIIPKCQFAAGVIEDTPEFQDVVSTSSSQ